MQARYYGNGIAVVGNTRPWKENLKAIGGSFNRNLNGQPGWMFGMCNEATVMQLIANANAGMIQPMTAPAGQVGAMPVAQPQMVPMGLAQPAMTPAAAMTRLTIAQPQAPRVPAPVPIMQAPLLTLGFPMAAKAFDGLVYQIIFLTLPMPQKDQKLILWVGETQLHYTVATVLAAAPPDPVMEALIRQDLAPDAAPDAQAPVSRAIISEGKWQIQGMTDPHTITFLPVQ